MPSLLEVRLFGRPRFVSAALPFAFNGPPRAVPLLAYLATRPGEPVARETLATVLWPDVDDATARANLRRHVHLVLKALPPAAPGEPWIVTTPTTLAWNAATLHDVDVATFERLSASAEPGALEAAVGRYAGDYLDGYDDEWVAERRGRLATQQLTNLERLIARAIAVERIPEALVYAQMMLAADPWREDAIRHVVRMKNVLGDRAGALAAYERFSRRLRDDIGVDPMPETADEYRRVVRGDAVSALVVDETPPQSAFVGRDVERATLATAISRVKRSHGSAIFVGGEAGIGKSALMDVFAAEAASAGVTVLRAVTASQGSLPYEGPAAIVRAVVERLGASTIEPIRLAALAPLVPSLHRHGPDLPELAALEGERDRVRLFDAAVDVVAKLAAREPLAIVVEDLHWSGSASIALLSAFIEECADSRVLIVATYRDEEVDRGHPLREARRRLSALPHVHRIALGPLGSVEIERMLAPTVALAERAALATALAQRTDGNAFFLKEIIRDRAERGPVANGALPSGLRETIVARLGRLSDRARGVAEFAAIVGRAFDVDLVREVGGWSEYDVLGALDELIDRHIVRDLGASLSYAFVHQLLATTIVETMDVALARRRNRRVAIALEQTPERDDELAVRRAVHFERGGEPRRAAAYYLQGAVAAARVFAHDDAIAFATHVVRLTDDAATTTAALLLREAAARSVGDRAMQHADLERLETCVVDEATAFEIVRRRVSLAHVTNDRAAETALLDVLAARARAVGTNEALAATDAAEGSYHLISTDYERAYENIDSARKRYAALGDTKNRLACMSLLMRIGGARARFDHVDRLLAEANEIEANDTDATSRLGIVTLRSEAAETRSDWESVAHFASEAIVVATEQADAFGVAVNRYRRGLAETWRFDVRRARNDLHEAAAVFERLGDRVFLARTFGELGTLEGKTGRFAAAIAATERQIDLSVSIGHRFGEAVGYTNLSYFASLAGDFERAAVAARRAVDMVPLVDSPRLHVESCANLAIAERGRGRFADAVTLMERAVKVSRERAVVADLAETLAQLSETYRCIGRLADARRISEEVLTLMNGVESDITHPQLLLWYAAKAFAVADPSRSLHLAHRAEDAMRVRAAAIPDAESQANYLALPYHQEIIARLGDRVASTIVS